jgi:hypothetical protein
VTPGGVERLFHIRTGLASRKVTSRLSLIFNKINELSVLPTAVIAAMIAAVGVKAVSRHLKGTFAQALLDAPDIEEG